MTPRRLMMWLFVAAGIPLVAGVFIPFIGPVGAVLSLLIIAVAVADLAISPTPTLVEVQREVGDVMSIGARNAVKIWFTNRNGGPITIEFDDEPPAPCASEGLPFEIELPPGRARYRVYHTRPHHRGTNQFGKVYLRSRSNLLLWSLHHELEIKSAVRIYPDIQAVHAMELLARRNRVSELGLRMSRLMGRGSEFERLREFRREDEYRQIDWKATAKHQKLISREYTIERNQNILILLDAGRSMCNEVDGITHLDRGLNAAIILSYIALRQGDYVGLMAFSNKIDRFVRPMRGAGSVQTLIRSVYDLEPQYEASDYDLMVEEVRRRFRKRSLVILISHALDELHLTTISTHMRQLRAPHLVLGAFLRNVPLHERLNTVPETDVEAFQVAAAAEMVSAQTTQIAELQEHGQYAVDSLPEDLSADLISQYLEIKARHLL
ncbi:hypothetical protein CA54_10000 [Symmachiella macrocystis]|uniref:DUF58 domain-containing protein n=1 Tax=Symmachiella macrocystis TaxID=2527985 RepID=A0A5C6BKB3_9PLAN|nr:DUF58 domain-containing protein [Symmachiella macrocystis]TWU12182.1 hypothetical protein CA54_10000 [Symmachiella macrocystis]